MIVDQCANDRRVAALDDARAKGARLVNLAENQIQDKTRRRFAPHIVLDVTTEMELVKREIFAPLLPILTYEEPWEVVDFINAHDRPLALYPFTHGAATRRYFVDHSRPGGVYVNSTIPHVVQHDLPFGDVEASGMGHYRGREGIDTSRSLESI